MQRTREDVFEILVREHEPALSAFLRSCVLDLAAAEDLTQETFLAAWHQLDQYDENHPFANWLRGIARNKALAYYRRAATAGRRVRTLDPKALAAVADQFDRLIPGRSDASAETLPALRQCLANLSAAGLTDRIRHVRKRSDAALGEVDGEVDLLYIDGAHRVGPARADIVRWGDRVSGGGTMLIHDSFSSIGVTLALLSTTFAGRSWRYVGRSRSMAEYHRENLGPVERVGNAARQVLQLPWFIRNVIIKVLLTLKLYPLTRIVGHDSRDWPY